MAHIDTRETVQSGRKFIKKAMKLPMLEPEHEQKLARLWKDTRDEKALHELTAAHVRLVVDVEFVDIRLHRESLRGSPRQ